MSTAGNTTTTTPARGFAKLADEKYAYFRQTIWSHAAQAAKNGPRTWQLILTIQRQQSRGQQTPAYTVTPVLRAGVGLTKSHAEIRHLLSLCRESRRYMLRYVPYTISLRRGMLYYDADTDLVHLDIENPAILHLIAHSKESHRFEKTLPYTQFVALNAANFRSLLTLKGLVLRFLTRLLIMINPDVLALAYWVPPQELLSAELDSNDKQLVGSFVPESRDEIDRFQSLMRDCMDYLRTEAASWVRHEDTAVMPSDVRLELHKRLRHMKWAIMVSYVLPQDCRWQEVIEYSESSAEEGLDEGCVHQ